MAVIPAEFPPPVARDEFVASPTAPEDERIDVGVLIVGGGPAGLAAAIRLQQLVNADPAVAEMLGETPVALVEKGRQVGSHLLSGAVVRPQPLLDLLPGASMADFPTYGEVRKEAVYFMTERTWQRILVPPPMKNHGNWVVSLSQLGRFLGDRAEELGVMVIPETSAQKLLVQDGAVRGVLTGDKGRGREGEELPNFEPGMEIHAGATVLAEGTQGHLTMQAIDHFGLRAETPQIWSLGVKEVWKVARPLDRVIHTLGWPLKMLSKRHGEFGGTWIYPMGQDLVSIGLVVGLDSHDATTSAHDLLQAFKTHPKVAAILEGGERHPKGWGAKTIPEGGTNAWPHKLYVPGAVFVGDGVGFTNVPALKGIHGAIYSGMMAAQSIYDALKAGEHPAAGTTLSRYDDMVKQSKTYRELWAQRAWRQGFAKGFIRGGVVMNMGIASRGNAVPNLTTHADAEVEVKHFDREYPRPDGALTFDKLSSVFAAGNRTRDDQPSHIRVEREVPLELAESWVNMCPAKVYEIGEEVEPANGAGPIVRVQVNASNCIQCGAITAKGGRLTPPEGGSGPEYQLT
jgi:electron-transferring-flavoprotein dehydrogenase